MSVAQFDAFHRVGALERVELFDKMIKAACAPHGKGLIEMLRADLIAQHDSLLYGLPYDEEALAESMLATKYGPATFIEPGDFYHETA